MAVGTGIGFNLDDLDKALKAADKSMERLLQKSGKFSEDMVRNFLEIGARGVDPFLSKLREQQTALEWLANVKLDGASKQFESLQRSAANALDSTNKLVEGFEKIARASATYNASAGLHDLKIIEDQIRAKERAAEKEAKDRATAYAQREKELNDFFNKEVAAEEKTYQRWLELKEKERATNEAVEREKHNRAVQNIGRQNAEYQKGEDARYQKWLELKEKERQREQADADAKWQRQKNTVYQQNAQFAAEELRQKQKNAEEERRINQQISKERIDQLGHESRERLKVEQMIRDTERRNHEARKKELNDLFREQERQAKAQAKYDSISRRERYKAYTTSYEGAIKTSDRAKTLAQEIQAVKNLEAARAKLNKTDADYQKKLDDINARIIQHNKNIAQATAGAKNLQKAHSKLGTTIASVFSIQAIRGYINQMIKVRGEMELQQRSLQAILQNKDAANEVWQKTIDLAVRSPFRIKDLVTYTKQLAAYRVESEKLYDTNKMLADVSAGLGVDMQRLILAFGQVKSANFLRGTELRQFTEAGIPMLDELAKLYTQMEGALVTSGDVFERISKRMVLFEDVEEVFKRMTAAGGTFYRMQEIQSETLKGQISNLKDSIDIMLNSMGKDMDGVLKKSVKSVKFLVDNYEVLIPILKGIIVALALYKVNSFAASEATLRMARSMKMAKIGATGLGGAWTSLRVGLAQFGKDLGKTTKMLASNPWLLLAAAIVTAAIKLNQFRKELEEVDKKYSQLLDKQGDVYLAFRQAGQKGDLEEQVAERRKQLQALVDMAKNEYGLVIDINVGEIDESNLEEEFNKIRQKMIELNAFSASFSKEMIKSDKLSKWADLGQFGVFEEGLFEDIQDLGGSYEKLYQEMINKSGRTVEILRDKWDDLTDAQKKAVEDLEKPIQGDESLVDYVNRLKDAYTTLLELKDVKNSKISRFIRSFNRDVREANVEFKLFANRFREEVNNIADEKEKIEFLDVSIGAMADEKEWSEFEENYIRRLVEQEFGITFAPKTATPEELKNWQKSYNALFKGDSGFREITATATSQSQVIERLNGTYESLKETIKRIEAAGKDSVLAGGAYEGQDLNKLKSDLAEVKRQLDWFGAKVKKGGSGKDEVLEKLKNRINLIKEMNKEYEKLNKTFSKAESLAKVQKAYADTAKELGLDTSTMDFTDEGTIKSLEALLGKPEYAANKYVIELQKALDNFKVELGVEVKQEKDQDLKAQVQELFDQYDLSLELKKLNIPQDLAKSLFDVDYLDLDGLKKAVQDQEAKFIGTDMGKEYKKFLEKIDDMEDKAAKERMKTYVKYLQEGMSERVKLKIEELRKLKEIEESDEFTPAQKERIKAGVSKEAKRAQDKQEWKDFQGSEMYTMMFEDLEFLGTKALDVLKNKLKELKGSLKDLPASEVKEIIGQISKIEDIAIQRNPFTSLRDAIKEVRELEAKGRTEEALQAEFAAAELKRQSYQEELDAVTLILGARENEIDLNQQSEEWQEKYGHLLGMQTSELERQSLILSTLATGQGMVASNAAKDLKAYADARKALSAVSNEWGTIKSLADKAYGSVKEVLESMGVESDSVAMSLADSAMNMVDLVFQAIMFDMQLKVMTAQAQLLGVAMNTALGPIGWIVLALQAVATLLSAIFSAKDKALQRQVEANLDTVKALQEKYETLEDSIDNAWDTASIQAYNQELKATTQSMIDAQKAAIAAQSKRKGANKEGSDAYNELQEMKAELDELEAQLDESLANSFSKVTDGILDGVHDAARKFTDAWWDAFVETGDGLSGLEENFNEMFLNLAKNQAAMQITGAFADRWKKDLEKYINADDTELTKDEAKKWAEEVRRTFPQLSDALEGYLGVFKDMASETQGAGLSALTKGIQGITADQAEILSSYWNSVRGYTASIDSKMDLILANMGVGAENNPMLEQLISQTSWLSKIHGILEDVASASPRTFKTSLI